MVKTISDFSEFRKTIKRPGLVVVDFFAEWCGPCKQIAPFIENLSTKYPNVVFIKVDVDKAEEISQDRGITAMPTFQFFVWGSMVDELKGADPNRLESLVKLHDSIPKQPAEMSITELKVAIAKAGLAAKTIGFLEKKEFVALLQNYYTDNFT